MRPIHLAPAGAVLAALAAIAVATQLTVPKATGPARAALAPRQVAVSAAIRACPPVPGGGSGKVALIAAPSATTSAATTSAATTSGATTSGATTSGANTSGANTSGANTSGGQAQLAPLPLAGTQVKPQNPVSQTQPGLLSLLTTPAPQPATKHSTNTSTQQGWSVTASGTMAQALEAEEAADDGLASVRCGEPGSDLWFVGPGQQSGASQIQLDLMNVDALAASVNVSVITDAGQVQAGGDNGITVAPRQTVTEALSSLAGGASVVAIEVRTSIGRVAADVSETSSHGGTASWLPNTAAPSTQLVIPGVPPSGGTAGLYLVVPGNANARINVLAITPQGQHRPFGAQTIDLPGDSASYVPLTPLGGMAALEVTANVPVTAGVLVPGTGLGAFAVATAPVSEQAVVAGNTSGATVVLSAPAGQARVRLTELAETPDATSSQVVTVQSGHTLTVPATTPKGAKHGSPFAVVVAPLAGSGPLYAARVQTQGQNTVASILPAVSALTTIMLPPARDSYDAISP